MSGLLRIISDGTAFGTVVMTERGEVVKGIMSVKFAPIEPGGVVTVQMEVMSQLDIIAMEVEAKAKAAAHLLLLKADAVKAWLLERGGASVALVRRHFGLTDAEIPALQEHVQRGNFLCRGWLGKGRWMPAVGMSCVFSLVGSRHQHAAKEPCHG